MRPAFIFGFLVFAILLVATLREVLDPFSDQKGVAILGLLLVLLPAAALTAITLLTSTIWQLDKETDTATETRFWRQRRRQVKHHQLSSFRRLQLDRDNEGNADVRLISIVEEREISRILWSGAPSEDLTQTVKRLNTWLDSHSPRA